MALSFICKKELFPRVKTLLSEFPTSRSVICSSRAARHVSTVQLSYAEYGTDTELPPVVIMHGLFGSKQNWRSISKAIEAKSNPPRKVIAVDARNHGNSPHATDHSYKHLSADIEYLLHSLHIKKAVIVGHSMGGRAMMYLALKYPSLVERAIFVDISPVRTPDNLRGMAKIFEAMQAIQVDPSLSMVEGRKLVKRHLMNAISDAATVDFLLLNLRKDESQGFYWVSNVSALEENFPLIAKFPHNELQSLVYNGPVLFIAGRRSDYVTESDLPKIQKIFPRAQLSWLDTGHLVQLEKPAEFISLVLNFINS